MLKELERSMAEKSPATLSHLAESHLSREAVVQKLAAAGIEGCIEPLVELYTWRNGPTPDAGSGDDWAFVKNTGLRMLAIEEVVELYQKVFTMDGDLFRSKNIRNMAPILYDDLTEKSICVDFKSPDGQMYTANFNCTQPIRAMKVNFLDFIAQVAESYRTRKRVKLLRGFYVVEEKEIPAPTDEPAPQLIRLHESMKVYCPALAPLVQIGYEKKWIEKKLNRHKIVGKTGPIVDWYHWASEQLVPDGFYKHKEKGIFCGMNFLIADIESAIGTRKSWLWMLADKRMGKMYDESISWYFPILAAGNRAHIAVNFDDTKNNDVAIICPSLDPRPRIISPTFYDFVDTIAQCNMEKRAPDFVGKNNDIAMFSKEILEHLRSDTPPPNAIADKYETDMYWIPCEKCVKCGQQLLAGRIVCHNCGAPRYDIPSVPSENGIPQ